MPTSSAANPRAARRGGNAGPSRLAVDVQFASRLPNVPSAAQFKRWVRAALDQPAALTVRIVNQAEGERLNRQFRGKPCATNVLTFVYHEPGAARLDGDIVLCAPIIAREARAQGKVLLAHYAHLTVHGALHLAGMDHEVALQAEAMEALETRILAGLGVPDPYA